MLNVCDGVSRYVSDIENGNIDHPYSENTVRAYVREVEKRLYPYLADKGIVDLDSVTKHTIRRYVIDNSFKKSATGEKEPCGISTKKTRVAAIQSFFEYLYLDGDIEHNPVKRYQREAKFGGSSSQKVQRLPIALTDSEVTKLLAALGKRKHVNTVRNLALVTFLLDTAVRAEELGSITVGQVEKLLSDEHTTIIGKGNKERTLRYLGDYRAEIEGYLSVAKKGSDDLLFTTQKGGRFTQPTVYTIVKKSLRAAEISKPQMGPHVLRHTSATRQLRRGWSIADVSFFLGHESIESTQNYLHYTIEN